MTLLWFIKRLQFIRKSNCKLLHSFNSSLKCLCYDSNKYDLSKHKEKHLYAVESKNCLLCLKSLYSMFVNINLNFL